MERGTEDMDKNEFLNMMEGILEVKPRTLEGGERVVSFEQWDSIAILMENVEQVSAS